MIIRVRRGLEANRTSYTPQIAELLFTTDNKRLYVGDGITPGGIQVDLSGGGIVQTVVAGENITVDNTDPANPVISAEGGAVDSVNGQTGVVVLDTDDITVGATNKFATAAEKTKLGFIAVTQSVDLDAMETKLAGLENNADVTDAGNVGAAIHGSSAKTTPVDADTISLIDSAASNALKKLSWANVKATLKTYFDTLYQPIATVLTNTTASFTTALETKLNGIEAGADVTDAANVDAAGALMESELLFPADVKAFEAADFANSSQGLLADSAVQPIDLATVATTGVYSDLTGKPTIPTSVDDLSPSQTGHGGKFLKTDGTDASWEAIPGGGDALTSNPLSQFAATTSLQLKNTLSDETGSGAAVFANSPALVTPTGIVKGDVGLGNVDNTADTAKPVSTAQQTALDLKAPLASPAFTGTPTGITKSHVGLGNVDNTSDATKQAATLLAAFPVGSIYISTNSTNPGTYLGGTWAAFGAGKVPVGFDSGDGDFDTDEETGGAKTVAGASHSHNLSALGAAVIESVNNLFKYRTTTATGSWNAERRHVNTGGTDEGSASASTSGVELAGVTDSAAAGATSVVQPYIVVRMWKRTA